MEEDSYRSVKSKAEGLYKEKGSKFISFVFPVKNEEEVAASLEEVKNLHHAARHHCYAWKLGMGDEAQIRFNDDGEPGNSAGKPILGQIDSHNLTEVLIVVVRYFGGVKLGVGGLINAYRTAAADAIDNAKITVNPIRITLHLSTIYEHLGELLAFLKQHHFEQGTPELTDSCRIDVFLPPSELESRTALLKTLHWLEITSDKTSNDAH